MVVIGSVYRFKLVTERHIYYKYDEYPMTFPLCVPAGDRAKSVDRPPENIFFYFLRILEDSMV